MPEVLHKGRPVYWQPHQGFQTRFLQAGQFEVLGGGAAGPGKSSCLIADAARDAQHPNCRGLFLRTEYTDMVDIRDRMMALYPQLGATWEATDRRWRFPSGGFVMLAHGGSMTDLGPLLGPEWTSVKFDELSLVKDEVTWQMILSRIRSPDPTVPLKARASANPIGPGREWLRSRFVVPCGKKGDRVFRDPDTGRSRAYVPGTAIDNPSLPASYWQGLKDLPPSIQQALRDGDWDMALGLFYPELISQDRLWVSANQVPPLLDWYEYWGSYDWGFVHPATFASFVRYKQTILWLDTLYMHRYQDDEQAAYIQGNAERRCLKMVYAGHDAFAKRQAHQAAAETVADVMARYSINIEHANIDKLAGAKVLRRFLAELQPGPRPSGHLELKIVDTPGNRRAVSELASLTPDALNPNVPAKRDANEKGLGGDDGADCFIGGTLIRTFRGDIAVESVRSGDLVLTRKGWRGVFASWQREADAPVFRLTMSDGSTLTGTGTHPVWTCTRGFVALDTLRYGDRLLSCPSLNASSSRGSPFGDTQTPNNAPIGVTTDRTLGIAAVGLVSCIKRFGSRCMGRFRRGIKYTTLTKIRSTIRLKIWNVSRQQNTAHGIAESPSRTPLARTLQAFDHSQPRGTARMPDVHTLRGTSQRHGRATLERSADATTAASNTHPVRWETGSFVERTVDRLPVEREVLTELRGHVRSAVRSSPIPNTTAKSVARRNARSVSVVSVEPAGSAVVYNLQTDDPDAAEYFASGILVHNCGRYGLASPPFEPLEPVPLWSPSNVTDGKSLPAPWEMGAVRMPSEDGKIDRREYTNRDTDPLTSQFGEGWG